MKPANQSFGWSAPQRRALLAALTVFLTVLTIRCFTNPRFVAEQPGPAPRAGELDDRIDPNTADWQTLAAIPSLGEKRAHAIVSHRDEFLSKHPGGVCFRSADDLFGIKGVGPSTAAKLSRYLIYPARAAK